MAVGCSSAQVNLEDFLERNRHRLFTKTSETTSFFPAYDSLQIVGCAAPAETSLRPECRSGSSSKYFLQVAVVRRTDYQRCLQDLFNMSLRKERKSWLLVWLLSSDRRYLAKLDADKVIMQGALLHRSFWLLAREDELILSKKGPNSIPRFDNLLKVVASDLGQLPDRMLTVSLMWIPLTRQQQQQQQVSFCQSDDSSDDGGYKKK